VWLHDTVRADVAELFESGLVQRVQDRTDLPIDRHELPLVQPAEQREDVLTLQLRHHQEALRDQRLRVVGCEDRSHRLNDIPLSQQVVDEDLLLHHPVEAIGVDLHDDGASTIGLHVEDCTVAAADQPPDRRGAQAPIGRRDQPFGGRKVEDEVFDTHRR
jgi:hypothetical protein